MTEQVQDENKLIAERRAKLESIRPNCSANAHPNTFRRTHKAAELQEKYGQNTKEELEALGFKTSIAGRIMAKRGPFLVIQDVSGRIQAYAEKGVQADLKDKYQGLDIGDIIGVTGQLHLSGKGDLYVNMEEYQLLTKALRPLPEKFHGLTDQETRYRQRYVDLIVNEESRQAFVMRSKVVAAIRNFMIKKEFMEVETPMMHVIPGGASARPFITHHNAQNIDMVLRIATELHLKRLIVGGMERVYEIGRIFRNEGMDATHNPEFTSIEVYQAYADFQDIMDLTEGIIQHAAKAVKGDGPVNYQGTEIKINEPFKRVHMVDAIKEITGVDFWQDMTFEEAKAIAAEKKVPVEKHYTEVGHIINAFFEEFVEETLIQPTFVYGHPVAVSPLAKKNPEDDRFTDRFELFIMTKEYGNAFTELNDPIDQLSRFEAQAKAKELGDDEATGIDYDYIEALEYGMPPTGGLGIGIDRLCMLLTDTTTIRDVLLFPTMK